MISGTTKLIAHLGYPTHSFKAPLIYNPYFDKHGIDAVVVPMGCKVEDYPAFLKLVFRLSNIHGALVTMPHKITTMGLLDQVSKNARVAGACNALRLGAEGTLIGDMFDGEGFVRGLLRRGRQVSGSRAMMTGAGGVGSAIAASLAQAGIAELSLFDAQAAMMEGLAERLRLNYPDLLVVTGSSDPAGYDIVVNATPLGAEAGDHALPGGCAGARLRIPGGYRHAV
jgi:shikimate dehydrogenase